MCWAELSSCFSDGHWSLGNICWKTNFTIGVCRLLPLTLGTVVTFTSGKKHGCLRSSLWLQNTSKVLRQDIWKNILSLSWVINNYMKHCFQLLTSFIRHLKEVEVPAGKVWAQMRITQQICIGLYYSYIKVSMLVFLSYLVLICPLSYFLLK